MGRPLHALGTADLDSQKKPGRRMPTVDVEFLSSAEVAAWRRGLFAVSERKREWECSCRGSEIECLVPW